MGQAPEAGCLTAACGFGYQGQCCCECALLLVAKPRCHHLGGDGNCGPYAAFDGATVLDKITHAVERERLREEQGTTYVCLAFASEGIAVTNWREHGSCEAWVTKK